MATINPIQRQKFLKGMDYPAAKQDLVEHAKGQGVDENALSAPERLTDEQYETPTDVSEAVGNLD